MAGAFDKDIPKAPVTDAAYSGYIDVAQKTTQLAEDQAAYIEGRNSTNSQLGEITKNLAEIKAQLDKDPNTTTYVDGKETYTKAEILAMYEDAMTNTTEALKLQAIINANDNAVGNAGPAELLKSDQVLTATGGSGKSTTGKYYLNGQEVTVDKYAANYGKPSYDSAYQTAYDKIKAENPEWTDVNIARDATAAAEKASGLTATGGVSSTFRPGTANAGGGGSSGGTGNLSIAGGPGTPADQQARKSAYDILFQEFNRYGLGSLVEPLKGLVQENISPSEFALRLEQTDAYKKRFSANADRISKGLTALSPAEYIGLEDSYQKIMRNYGLPSSYWAKDSLGTQAGFNQLIGNDVDSTELEDRVMTAQNRVQNANPEVAQALKAFYPDITNGDILAYALDPTKALDMIKRKVTAAEIGGAALSQGLTTSAQSAEDLARYGVNAAQAQQGYNTIAGMLPRASELSSIYKQDPYTQAVAESDVFGTAGSAAAVNKRKKLTALETSSFSGSSGAASNALSRDRSSSQMQYRESGAGAF